MTQYASISVDRGSLAAAQAMFGDRPRLLRRELRIAVGKTLQWAESRMAKQVVEKVKVAQRDVKGVITRKQEAGQVGGHVRMSHHSRIELRDFGARQVGRLRRTGSSEGNAEHRRIRNSNRSAARRGPARARQVNESAGTTYQIDRQGGRKLLPQGFVVDRYSGSVFVRNPGDGRLPIHRVYGVSPWGAYIRNEYLPVLAEGARERLAAEVRERLRSFPHRQAAAAARKAGA